MGKIDPQRIFISGEAFFEVSKLLVKELETGSRDILGLVLGTVFALTLEIYLKCLLHLECGSTFGGHDVHKLFHHLPSITQSQLTAEHDNFLEANPNLVAKLKANGMSPDLESLLLAGRNTFNTFRYAYEEIPTDNWALNGLIKCVREKILTIHPDWGRAFHNARSTSHGH